MSAIQIVDRSAGQTILASFFQDIKSAFGGDFMGRDVNGNPASGNNCGTAAYPWGTGYFSSIILGGTALTTTQLERPSYQIVSGKKRSSSNQPQFLQAAGASASFNLLASSTNLVLTIAGVTATWIADKNSIAATVAPGSNNTATVNDALATGQAATRTWGEYGSGQPYYAITISSVGSNISNRVGSFQAFKVGTEYFIAYVESATSLSRCFRGFFFDSSGNPVKRAAFSNGATITLMNLGYVFADQDLTTVDVIFTGAGVNNAPTNAYTSPSSPASGDYWYDLGNSVWKRYNGSAWILVNRILVGMVVCDATNCVASRSFDFFGLCRSDNTVEMGGITNTTVKAAGPFQRINVNGNLIAFGSSRPVWDTASNLAGSTDRYNAAVTASTTEYFYVTDQGDVKISDIEPYWRPDLLGYYHPFQVWRWVGTCTTDGSANFLSTGLNSSFVSGPSGAKLSWRNPVVSNTNASNNLAIVRGAVNGTTGALLNGEGFSSSLSVAVYTVTFTTAFADTPTVTANVSNTSGSNLGVSIMIRSVSTTGFTADVWSSTAGVASTGLDWNFQAIGQRV